MKQFDTLLEHSDSIVSETAELLKEFTTSFENGEMSEAEYKELSCDLLDMQRIDDMSMTLSRKTDIAKAFAQLMEVVGVIGKFV